MFLAAVAARDRIQNVIDALDFVNEGQQKVQSGSKSGHSAAKTVRPGGPPDHWVELVARHAPELLQRGPRHVINRQPASNPDRGIVGHDRSLEGTGRRLSDRLLPTQEFQSPLPESDRVPRRFGRPAYEPPAAARSHADNAAADAVVGIDKTAADNSRDGGTIFKSNAVVRSGSAKRPVTAELPPDEPVSRQGETSGSQHREDAVTAGSPAAGYGGEDNPDKTAVAADGLESNRDTAKKHLTDLTRARIPGAVTPAGTSYEAGYQRKSERHEKAPDAARVPNAGEVKRAANDGIQAGRVGASQQRVSAPEAVAGISALRTGTGRASVGQVAAARETGRRRRDRETRPMEELPLSAGPPEDPRWPALPGEEETADAGDYSHPAIWPGLPASGSDRAAAPDGQAQSYPAGGRIRSEERLRRIDEEQKGKSWSASHF